MRINGIELDLELVHADQLGIDDDVLVPHRVFNFERYGMSGSKVWARPTGAWTAADHAAWTWNHHMAADLLRVVKTVADCSHDLIVRSTGRCKVCDAPVSLALLL